MARGRWHGVVCAAFAAAMLAVPATAAAPTGIRTEAALERSIVAELNALRRSHGLPSLRVSRDLGRAAEGHSRAMARLGFFAHSSRDGTAFWKRIARSYASGGYARWAVGENLLWSSSELDAGGAVRMWLDSPTHRRVMLSTRWRELGISAVRADSAPGVFHGREVVVVTADFGVRG